MVELKDWIEDLVIDTGCTKAIARRKLLEAAIEFCTVTNAWEYQAGPLFTIEGESDYRIWPAEGTKVGKVIRLIDPDANDLEYTPLARPGDYQNGHRFYHGSPTTLTLYPEPRESRELSLTISLIPTRASTEIGDIIGERWFDALLEGALYRLKLMPGREWSDPAMAKQHHERLFRRYIGDAIQAANVGFSDAPQTVKHVPFG